MFRGQILSAAAEQLKINSYFKCRVGITSLQVQSSEFKTRTRMSHITAHCLSLETLGISFGEGWCRERPAVPSVPVIPAHEKLDYFEFKASLVYIASYRLACAT